MKRKETKRTGGSIQHTISVISLEKEQLIWQRWQQWFSDKSMRYDALFSILNNHSVLKRTNGSCKQILLNNCRNRMCQSEYTVELRDIKKKHLHCRSFSLSRVVVLPFLMHCPPVVLQEKSKRKKWQGRKGRPRLGSCKTIDSLQPATSSEQHKNV